MLKAPWYWMLAVLLGWATPASALPPAQEPSSVSLGVGTQKVLGIAHELRGFEVRDRGRVEVRSIGNRQLLLTGAQEGLTELVIYGRHGPIQRFQILVRSQELICGICDACTILPAGHQLRIGVVGDILTVRGVASSLEVARGVRLMREEFPRLLVDVKLTEQAVRAGLLRVNHELWRAGFLEARAIITGDQVLLTGRFKSDADETRARATIAPYVTWLEERLGLPILQPTL
jgi:hypothetical protein